jgi:hypothetical protein
VSLLRTHQTGTATSPRKIAVSKPWKRQKRLADCYVTVKSQQALLM